MDKRFAVFLIILMNGLAGVSAFQLVQEGTMMSKLFAFGAWLCGNVLAIFGQPVVTNGKPPTAPPSAPVDTSLRALLPLALCALSLSACVGAKVWGACTLGQLPQVAQPAIPTIVTALEQDSGDAAVSAVEAVGLGLLPGQVSCIVQAIAADEEARAQNTQVGAMRSRASIRILINARTFLQKHPATACADTRGVM